MAEKTKSVGKTIVNVILWIFLIFALIMTIFAFMAQANADGIPKIGDKCILTVETDSMKGPNGFPAGSMIISRALETDDEKRNLEVDQVITFLVDLTPDDGIDNKVLNTHRIISKDIDAYGRIVYKTKGDNNVIADTYDVRYDSVKAIWEGKSIPGIGAVIAFLQSSTGFLVCIVIPLFLFFVYELYVFITVLMKVKNKGKKQITAADEELIKQRAVEEYLKQKSAEAAGAAAAPAETKSEAEEGWTCACGCKNITSKFCPECGAKKPEEADTWTCPACGCKDITSKFCPECGAKRQ